MKPRDFFLLGLLGLVAISGVACFQLTPGYMDADYYFAGGLSLVRGQGFHEEFLWNYLNDPSGLPTPSHAYWMPFASIVSMLGMLITGVKSFATARLFFILVSAIIGPLTAKLSFSIFSERRLAILAGVYAAVPGFYLAYLGTTDVFGLYMFLGGLWFLTICNQGLQRVVKFLILGSITGFMHLTRADGIIWLGVSLSYVFIDVQEEKPFSNSFRTANIYNKFLLATVLVCGYLLVMGPWMVRNAREFGTLLSPGGLRSLWLTNYNDLYTYPGSMLTSDRWLESGAGAIINSRLRAFSTNLQTSIVVQGEIFLAPLIVLGAWKEYNRHKQVVQAALIAWILTFVEMTLIFPEVGWRGGFFHSGAATQMLFWVFAPVGLNRFIDIGVRIRGWHKKQAWSFFQIGTVMLVILLTLFVASRRVIGGILERPVWDQSEENYVDIEGQLLELGATQEDVVLVNNPPGYYIATGRSALVIPNGGIESLTLVAHKYGGDYLILEPNHPEGLEKLYQIPSNVPGLEYLRQVNDSYIYKVTKVQ